jgi:exosortase A
MSVATSLLPAAEPEQTEPAQLPLPPSSAPRWRYGLLIAALCALLGVYLPTAAAMAEIWWRSQTFAHGFLILPVCLWLVWRQRDRLAAVRCRPSPPMLLVLAALGATWMLAAVANVQVLQQYMLVSMLAVTVAAVLGWRYAAAIAFPLAYLLLAVPFGEVFIPPLIEFTTRFTVGALQMVGIPVFQENNYLALPSGNWSVVEACSGLRYLIASVALGTLYAYLTYRSPVRRVAFMVVAVVLPVLANGVRAFTIVLVGHLSNMTLAVGIDHLIYGWLFFGLVSVLMFWTGARWREAALPLPAGSPAVTAPSSTPAAFAAMALAAVLVAAVWPPLAGIALQAAPPDRAPEARLSLLPPPPPWRTADMAPNDWHVLHRGQPQRWQANYIHGASKVSLQLTWYRHQSKGEELLARVWNALPLDGPQWKELASEPRTVRVGSHSFTVEQTIVQAGAVKLLVWRWYRQAGVDTDSPLLLKLLLARSKLLGGADGAAEISLTAGYDEQPAQAAAAMHNLLTAMLPAINQGLDHVAGR